MCRRLLRSKYWLPCSQSGWWPRGTVAVVAALVWSGMAAPVGAQPVATLTAELTGTQVLPGPGADAGSAQAAIALHARQVCWDLRWDSLEPTEAHLHRGAAGEVGPVVVGLFAARAPVTRQTAREGCTGADPNVIQAMQQEPGNFYAQLRTRRHPDGAVRGQLAAQQSGLPRTGDELPSPWAVMTVLTVVGLSALVPALVRQSGQGAGER